MRVNIKYIVLLETYLYLQVMVYRLLIGRYLSVFTTSIPDGAEGILPTNKYMSIELSEEMDPATVNMNTVFVKDSQGNIVDGDVYLADDGKTIIFIPKYAESNRVRSTQLTERARI